MASEHGSTPAAWTAVAVALTAFMVGGIGLILGPNWVVFWIGVVLLPVALVIGRVMESMGMGKNPARRADPEASRG